MKRGIRATLAMLMALAIVLSFPVGAYAAELPPQSEGGTERQTESEVAAPLTEGETGTAAEHSDAATETDVAPQDDAADYPGGDFEVDNLADLKTRLAAAPIDGKAVRIRLMASFETGNTLKVPSGANVTLASGGSTRRTIRMSAASNTMYYGMLNCGEATLVLDNINVTGRRATDAAPSTEPVPLVYLSGGKLDVVGGTQLASHYGSAISGGSSLLNEAKITIKDSIIKNTGSNRGSNSAPAVVVSGATMLTIENSDIHDNDDRALLALNSNDEQPTVALLSGKIYNNKRTDGYGAGISLQGANFIMSGGEITGNTASKGGAGIYAKAATTTNEECDIYLYGGKVAGNTVPLAKDGPDVFIGKHTSGNLYNRLYIGNPNKSESTPVVGRIDAATGLAVDGIYNEAKTHENVLVAGALSQNALVVLQDQALFANWNNADTLQIARNYNDGMDINYTITQQDCKAIRVEALPGWELAPNAGGTAIDLKSGLQQRINTALAAEGITRANPATVQLPAGVLSTGLKTIAIGSAGNPQHVRLVSAAASSPTVLLRAPGNDAFAGSLFTVHPGSTLVLDNVIIDGNTTGGHREASGLLVEVGSTGSATNGPEGDYYRNHAHLYIKNNSVLRNNTNNKDDGNPGGALYVGQSGYVLMESGTITGNKAARHSTVGGAVLPDVAGGGVHLCGTMQMTGGTITANSNMIDPATSSQLRGNAIYMTPASRLLLNGKPQIGTSDSDNHLLERPTGGEIGGEHKVWIYGAGLAKGARINTYTTYVQSGQPQLVAGKRERPDFIFANDGAVIPTAKLTDAEAMSFYNTYDQQVGIKHQLAVEANTYDTHVAYDPNATKPAPPEKPTIAAFAGNAKATVTITPAAKDAKNVSEYQLYLATTENGTPSLKAQSGTSGVFEVTGLTNGTTYYFTGVVVTRGGQSAPSNVAAVTPNLVYSPATGVHISAGETTLDIGGTALLSANVMPLSAEQKVTWSVSDETVVHLAQSGEGNVKCSITALAAGTAYVTATSADGRAADVLEVTVLPAPKVEKRLAFTVKSKNINPEYGLMLSFAELNETPQSITGFTMSVRGALGGVPTALAPRKLIGPEAGAMLSVLNAGESPGMFSAVEGMAECTDILTVFYCALNDGKNTPCFFLMFDDEAAGRYYLRAGLDEDVWDEVLLNILPAVNPSDKPADYAEIWVDKAAVPFDTFRHPDYYNANVNLLTNWDSTLHIPCLDGASVRFTDKYNDLNSLFKLAVIDDNTIGVEAQPGAVLNKSSYKGQLEVTTGAHLTKQVTLPIAGILTLKINKAQPKIAAESISVDAFLQQASAARTRVINICDDGVRGIRTSTNQKLAAKNAKLGTWLALKYDDGTTTGKVPFEAGKKVSHVEVLAPEGLKGAAQSSVLYLEVWLYGWGTDDLEATNGNWIPVAVPVKRLYSQPALALAPGSVSLYGTAGASAELVLKPKSSANTIAALGVREISVSPTSPLKGYEVDANAVNLANGKFVLRATGAPVSGTVRLNVSLSSTTAVIPLDVKVKAIPAGTKIALKPGQKTITLNPNITGGDVRTLAVGTNIPGFDLSQYELQLEWQGKTKPATGEINIRYAENNQLEFSVGSQAASKSYKLKLAYKGVNLDKKKNAVDVTTTITVKVLPVNAKYKPAATLTVKGGLNLTTGSAAVASLNFKNYEGTLASGVMPKFKLTLKGADGANTTSGARAYIERLHVTPLGGSSWLLRLKPGQSLPTGAFKLEMLETNINATDTVGCKAVNFKVTASKPIVTLGTKSVTLAGKDNASRAYFTVQTTSGGAPIASVGISTKREDLNPFKIVQVSENRYYVAFKNENDMTPASKEAADKLRASAKKSTTLTLNLYVDSCEMPVAALKLAVQKVQ